ncbi:MAG: YbjN domain-containing protein [Deltaproteobacteria bacterium]|nr:YbjN domain-containing protein [Deltaproteobacteria bacterium]
MNAAEIATAKLIEQTLKDNPAYRKIDDSLYVVRQGSTYVMINIVSWGPDRALVCCVAQLVKGVKLDPELAKKLLELNAHLRFGAFAYEPDGDVILFLHSILGGETLNREELLATVKDVAVVADDYDDRIRQKYGGQTMKDLLEEAALERILLNNRKQFLFEGEN